MGQPVVLPKFDLPGDKRHWAVKAAWITGGLLLLSMVGLGAAIVNHRNRQTQAHIDRAEAIAKVKAEAEAKVAVAAAAVAAAKAEKEAALAAKAAEKAAATGAAGAGTDPSASGPGKSAKANHGHRARVSRGAKGTKIASKTGAKSESSKASNKPDAIDELLRKMK